MSDHLGTAVDEVVLAARTQVARLSALARQRQLTTLESQELAGWFKLLGDLHLGRVQAVVQLIAGRRQIDKLPDHGVAQLVQALGLVGVEVPALPPVEPPAPKPTPKRRPKPNTKPKTKPTNNAPVPANDNPSGKDPE